MCDLTPVTAVTGHAHCGAINAGVREAGAASLDIRQANGSAHQFGMSLLVPGARSSDITQQMNAFPEDCGLLLYRKLGRGHSLGVLSHYPGREVGLELREDIDTVQEPEMVISMEPMLTVPDGQPGAGGNRGPDNLLLTQDGAETITASPDGPDFNLVRAPLHFQHYYPPDLI